MEKTLCVAKFFNDLFFRRKMSISKISFEICLHLCVCTIHKFFNIRSDVSKQ